MKRHIGLYMLIIVCCVSLAACGKNESENEENTAADAVKRRVFAMDTVMDLTLYADEAVADNAESLIRSLEDKFSVTDSQSEIAVLNSEKTAAVSSDTKQLLEEALALCEKTNGRLDLSIYPVVKAWGFTTRSYRVPDDEELEELLANVSYSNINIQGNTVTLGDNMEIDLGSVAKGYTGDRLLDMLKQNGVTSAMLNLGGNVQTLGAKPDKSPWSVAVADPEGGYAGAISVTGKSVITSGGYERCFEADGKVYHHIIDPRTGAPAESGFSSVTIIGDSGLMCDAYSTALYVMGPQEAFEYWKAEQNFEAVFITDDGTLYITEGLENDFTPLGRFAEAAIEVLRRD